MSQPHPVNLDFISHSPWWEFVRFAVVGCLNILVSSLIFYLAYKHLPLGQLILENTGYLGEKLQYLLNSSGIKSIDALTASVVAYLGGMANSFILNRSWTFRVEEYSSRQIWRFVVLNLAGLTLVTALMFLFVDTMSGPYFIVWGATITLTTILNYLGNKYWTFAS